MSVQLEDRQEEVRRYNNPRHQGVIHPGRDTYMLLRFLHPTPGHWFFHSEPVQARSKGEIDWALLYLVREGLAESRLTELPSRKPILRYKIY